MLRPHKPMLYIRRFPGEAILLFDNRSETRLDLIEVDPDARTMKLLISGESEPRIFQQGPPQSFLQGDGEIRLGAIQEFRDGCAYANIGIHVPRDILIRRGEMLTGTTREERASMVR